MNYYIVVKYNDSIIRIFENFDDVVEYCEAHPNVRIRDYAIQLIPKQ